MTNPDNIIRVRARNGGRASVYEANAWCQNWTTGFVEGSITQNTSADMNVLVGGSTSKPSVAIAATPAPYNIALDIVGQKAIAITAPASNSRYSAIVAYTDDLSLATTEDTVTGSPASCGLIVVNGTAASTPVYPTEATIRTAITADGATGSQAAYVVLAYVLVSSTTTTITNTLITNTEARLRANSVATDSIKDGAITSSKIDFTTFFGDLEKDDQQSVSLTTTLNTVQTISNLEAGTYLVLFDGAFHHADNVTRNVFLQYTPSAGNNSYQSLMAVLPQADAYWSHHSGVAKVKLTADGSIAVQMKGETSLTVTLYHARVYAIKIG